MVKITAYEAFVLYIRRQTPIDAARRLMSIGLLKQNQFCSECGTVMILRMRKTIDGCCWCCNNSKCSSYSTTKSIRTNSFFSTFRISIIDIFTVIFCWTMNKSVNTINMDFNISKRTIIDIFQKLRILIKLNYDNDPIRLGGVEQICQIDESLFCHKVKAHRGRAPSEQLWVFGIVDVSFTPARGYMEIVENRSANTLLPIIQRVCKPGTIIYSDEWGAYNNITQTLNFIHYSVNHSLYFVDPISGVHTQNIESYWNRQKLKLKALKGVRRNYLEFYLAEFLWKDMHSKNTHIELFKIMRLIIIKFLFFLLFLG